MLNALSVLSVTVYEPLRALNLISKGHGSALTTDELSPLSNVLALCLSLELHNVHDHDCTYDAKCLVLSA